MLGPAIVVALRPCLRGTDVSTVSGAETVGDVGRGGDFAAAVVVLPDAQLRAPDGFGRNAHVVLVGKRSASCSGENNQPLSALCI